MRTPRHRISVYFAVAAVAALTTSADWQARVAASDGQAAKGVGSLGAKRR